MARMYTKGKGISGSSLPYSRRSPSWTKNSKHPVSTILLLAQGGHSPSEIGRLLRDQSGIPQVKAIVGSKILRILKAAGYAPEVPEDLANLINRADSISRHISFNKRDKDSKYRLILTESKIHRLSRYYKLNKVLPPAWKYISFKDREKDSKSGGAGEQLYDEIATYLAKNGEKETGKQ